MSNTIDWGKIHFSSWSPETNLTGTASAPSFTNTQSIELDGVDDYVDVGTIAELDSASAFTYSGWYKQTTLDQERFLMGFYISSTRWFAVYTWSNGQMYVQFKDAGVNKYGAFDYSTLVTANTWFNIIIVFNGSGSTNADRLKCYIDGTQATLSYVGTQPTTTPSGNPNLTLGKSDAYSQTFLGKADELALWNTDESANISEISSAPIDLSTYSPLGWWRFEGTGTTATDSGTGGNNGTLTNGATRSTDVPT